jgi:crotonobetainyl-CoA:carnitine CoA-transferase CaiB-like acyl-CoA transferase
MTTSTMSLYYKLYNALIFEKVAIKMFPDSIKGRRVLELGTMLAAPFACHILAELGAEVIKVEPLAGDPTRALVRGGPSGTFIAYSHGKKSVAMDLGTEVGRSVFASLLASADIVVHNLSPASARKLKVTYEDCRVLRSNIIFCHIRGYGEGPMADELASNPVAEASTGVMEANRVNGRPSRLGPSYHDQFAGAYAVIGIMAALVQREPSEKTHKIEIGLYETGLHVAARDLAGVQLKTQLLGTPEREPHGEFAMPGYGAYQSSDERWVYLLMLNDGHWLKFCQALGLPEADEEVLRKLKGRKQQRVRVEATVKAAVGALPYKEIVRTEVLPIERVLDAPQARHPGKLVHHEFRNLEFDLPAFPGVDHANLAGLPPRELGADTREVLTALGVSESRYSELLQAGAILDTTTPTFAWAPVRNTT